MKISIFYTIGNERTDGYDRGDAIDEAVASYHDLADEVVEINGNDPKTLWPWEWSWEQLPKAMNAGLEKCTGDWVIRCDIDYIFHEKDIPEIRKRLQSLRLYPVATFQKYSFVLHNRFYQKGGVPIAINKGSFADIRFGEAENAKTDLCYPIRNNRYEPDTFGKVGLPFYNYDYTFKTLEQTREEFWRFSRAYQRYFGEWKFGNTEEASFNIFIDMMKGRLKRCPYTIGVPHQGKKYTHPKYIRDKLSNISPEQFGHSGWGLLQP